MHLYKITLRVGSEQISTVAQFKDLWEAFADAQLGVKKLKKDGIIGTISDIQKLDKKGA